jgi:hypothetical protein
LSTTYSGVPGNVSLGSVVQVTIPQDGVDTEGVASVNTPFQKIADYLEYLRNGSGAEMHGLAASGGPGTFTCSGTANTDTAFTGNPGPNWGNVAASTWGSDVTADTTNGRLTAVRAGRYRISFRGYFQASQAGTIIHFQKNTVVRTIPNGTTPDSDGSDALVPVSPGGYVSLELTWVLAAADYVQIAARSNVASATIIYVISTYGTLSTFRMERVGV